MSVINDLLLIDRNMYINKWYTVYVDVDEGIKGRLCDEDGNISFITIHLYDEGDFLVEPIGTNYSDISIVELKMEKIEDVVFAEAYEKFKLFPEHVLVLKRKERKMRSLLNKFYFRFNLFNEETFEHLNELTFQYYFEPNNIKHDLKDHISKLFKDVKSDEDKELQEEIIEFFTKRKAEKESENDKDVKKQKI